MKTSFLCLAMAAASSCGTARGDGASPVVVELYTSQGCSSCPPADALLAELGSRPGVIALAFHVDYWDGIGWRDPFSSPRWTQRQSDYGEVLRSGNYTPQLVVGGRAHVVGSDRTKALALMSLVTTTVKVSVSAHREGGHVKVTYDAGKPGPGAVVLVALTESGLRTSVERGENGGRELRNDHVVRVLEPAAGPSGEVSVPVDGRWRDLRAVVLVQDGRTMAILGAAAATVL